MKINSHNEWDKLREVIVGSIGTRAALIFPTSGPLDPQLVENAEKLAREAYPQWLIDEIAEDQDNLSSTLSEFGVKVLRPNTTDIDRLYSTGHWSAAGDNVCNTRDLHLVVGDTVIESPSQERHRQYEATALADLWLSYMNEGFRWVVGPRPKLIGDYAITYYEEGKRYIKLKEDETLFEAANTVRMGRDLLYLVSRSGNHRGAQWLQSVLGDEYRVHTTEGIYRSSHIDSTVLALRPGLVLLNAKRVDETNCPEILYGWDKIWFEDIVPTPPDTLKFQEEVRKPIHQQLAEMGVQTNLDGLSSDWIGMNVLSIDPEHVVVDQRQTPLIRTLEKHALTPVPIRFRHSYMTGGIHCNTLDTVRDSALEDYFK